MKIAVSTLSLKEPQDYELNEIEKFDIDYIHVDVMDGIFVENKTQGLEHFYNITRYTSKPKDIHLMVSDVKKYIDSILSGMGIEYQLECRCNDDEINFAIESSDNPLLIGKDGKCLDALLTLLKVYISKISDGMMVGLDIGGYRANRKRQLEVLATKTAKEVAKTKIEVKLKPMNAYERKIIHEKLADWRDVYTESEGEGADRALVIKPKK